MKKRLIVSMLTVVALLVVPIPSYAKTAQEGTSNIKAVTYKKSKIKHIVVASVYDDKDQPCYVGGKYVGNCSRNKPYLHLFPSSSFGTNISILS